MIESLTEKLASIYSVRVWDAFWQNWAMIPITGLGRDEAIQKAIEISDLFDCGDNGTCEAQVWIECMGGTAYQMVGYVELDENDEWSFVEEFC